MSILDRRQFLACAAGQAFGLAAQQRRAQRPLNFVFILVDDMGWRDLGCYGSSFYETPNIDLFSKQAMRFTSAYAACPVCSPTRASILTGKYPARLHLTDWDSRAQAMADRALTHAGLSSGGFRSMK